MGAVVAALVAATVPATASADPGDYDVTGIDVSHHQGDIDWPAVAGSGVDFAYAKATEGVDFVDSRYAENRAGARAAGIYFGAYAFGRPDQGNPRGQADRLVDTGQHASDGRTLPPMLDIEWRDGSPTCFGLSTTAMVSWIGQFLDQVRVRTGRKAMIYTNPTWWNPCTGSSTAFGSYPLFHSRYASEPGALPAGWRTWTAWQYTASGSVPGVSGNVDRDVFNGTMADLAALCGARDPESSGTVWDRGRDGAGAWDASARLIDGSGRVTDVSSAALPDGTLHVQTVVPGSGVWTRARSAAGVWQTSATRIDTNGSITAVSSAVLPDGTLHVQTVVPGSGVWSRARSASGGWATSAERIDTNGHITDVAAAGLPNGTIHVLVVVPNSGVWHRVRGTAGTWGLSATPIDLNERITDVSVAGLPDGTLHAQTLVPNSGIWDRTRSAAGTWAGEARQIDTNPWTRAVSAAALPNGTLHVDVIVPNSGVWHRVRWASGTWDASAKLIDTNGSLLDICTAGLPNGTLHVGVLAD